jgi:succinate dehydrogenase/fumarate reductase flavoprotein subunit
MHGSTPFDFRSVLGLALSSDIDVIVGGSGNAGSCIAHAAREAGAQVVLLGNFVSSASAFATGARGFWISMRDAA